MEEMSGPVTRSRTSSLVSLEAGPSTSPSTEEVVRTRVRLVESATSGFGDEPKKKKVKPYAYWHIWGCLSLFALFRVEETKSFEDECKIVDSAKMKYEFALKRCEKEVKFW